jgi:hypothetical protein
MKTGDWLIFLALLLLCNGIGFYFFPLHDSMLGFFAMFFAGPLVFVAFKSTRALWRAHLRRMHPLPPSAPQLVGHPCPVCRAPIATAPEALFCETCKVPVHRDCSRQCHPREIGPYR